MLNSLFGNKYVVGGIVLAVVVGLGYYVWQSQSNAPLLSQASATSPSSEQILATLSQLHTIQLDPTLFSDPTFQSLSDFGVTIPSQSAGRRNPFAPLGQ